MKKQKPRRVYTSKTEFLDAWAELRQKDEKTLKTQNMASERHNRGKGANV